jgi:hypothetical protein
MLNLRMIEPDDYLVLEDGQQIGRIRLAKERSPPMWSWSVNVLIPGPRFGSAESLASGWEAFKARQTPEKLAIAYETMNHANRPDRYGQ